MTSLKQFKSGSVFVGFVECDCSFFTFNSMMHFGILPTSLHYFLAESLFRLFDRFGCADHGSSLKLALGRRTIEAVGEEEIERGMKG